MKEKLIYILKDDGGYLFAIYDTKEDAEKVIAEIGNEFWSIESEVMC